MALNWEKFKTLVHYICERAEDPGCLGAIKLNKVLWYSDSIQYMLAGRSITGETYVKRQYGPVPRDIIRALNELVAEKKVARGKVDHFGYMKNEYISISHESPDLNQFTGDEISLVNEAFQHVCFNHTAQTVSDETHETIWQIAMLGEEIPLATRFAAYVGEVDETDISWANEKLALAA